MGKIKAPGSIFVELGMRIARISGLSEEASTEIMLTIAEWTDRYFDSDGSMTHIEIENGKVTKVESVETILTNRRRDGKATI